MFDVQTCPRRMQEGGPWAHEENLDSWLQEARHEGDPTPHCSFCGSLHPERFLELIAAGWVVEPTDKTYKAYLQEVYDTPKRALRPDEPLSTAFYGGRAKFYYQHLDEEQAGRFIALYNDSTMRIARPGYFYVLPFFMGIGRSDGTLDRGGRDV